MAETNKINTIATGEADPNTLLLLTGESMDDYSNNHFSVKNFNASVSSTRKKFGNKSLYFNGKNSRIEVDIGELKDKFTLDFWVNIEKYIGYGSPISFMYKGAIFGQRPSGGITVQTLNSATNCFVDEKASRTNMVATPAIPLNTWTHIAITKNGNAISFYFNGKKKANINVTDTEPFTKILLGCLCANSSTGWFNGYVDEFRISDVIRWNTDFTPPTEPYPIDPPPPPEPVPADTSGIIYASREVYDDFPLGLFWNNHYDKNTDQSKFSWQLKYVPHKGETVNFSKVDYFKYQIKFNDEQFGGSSSSFTTVYPPKNIDGIIASGSRTFSTPFDTPLEIKLFGKTKLGNMVLGGTYYFGGSNNDASSCRWGFDSEFSRYQWMPTFALEVNQVYSPIKNVDIINYTFKSKKLWSFNGTWNFIAYLNNDKKSPLCTITGQGTWNPEQVVKKGTIELSPSSRNFDVRISMFGGYTVPLIQPPQVAETIINGADNFNDEENPKIYFSNDQMRNVLSMEVGILDASQEGEEIIIVPFRKIKLPSNEYTFNFTEEERNNLRKSCITSNSKLIKYVIKTKFSSKQYETSSIKTLSIINGNAIINPIIEDTNPVTVALTGDKNTLIKKESTVTYNLNAQARKFATITGTKIKNYTTSFTTPTGKFDNVESPEFEITVLDSRGNILQDTVKKNIINYIPLTCNFKGRGNLDGQIKYSINGFYYNGSFGATNNTIDLKYRYKTNSDPYGDWIIVQPAVSKDNYSASGIIEGLDYRNTYTFQIEVKDKLHTINLDNEVIKTLPVYDWSEEDFNLNVPIHMSNNKIISETKKEQGVIYSGIGNNMYIRPSGGDSDYNQIHISDATGVDINANTVIENSLTVKGNLNVDSEFLLRDLSISNELNVNGAINANGGVNSLGDITLGTDFGLAFKNNNALMAKDDHFVRSNLGVESDILDLSNSFYFLGAGITSTTTTNHPVITDDKLCRFYILVFNNPSLSSNNNDYMTLVVREDIEKYSPKKVVGFFLTSNQYIYITIKDNKITLGQSTASCQFRIYGVR